MPPTQTTTVPEDLGELKLVPEGWQWRPGQHALAEQIANSPKKIVMLEAECGTGKSLIPTAVAKATGASTVILIQTIQLQKQYLRDLQGLVMMAGRRHSICNITEKPADRAPCTIGVKCALKGRWTNGEPMSDPECNYFKRKADAARSHISVHNYAYWLGETSNQGATFDKDVELIICDEAHELDQIMMAAGVVPISLYDCDFIDIPRPKVEEVVELQSWAREHYKAVADFKIDIENQARMLGLSLTKDQEIDEQENDTQVLGVEGYVLKKEAIDEIVAAYGRCQRVLGAMADILALREADLGEWVIKQPTAPRWILEAQPIYGKYGFKKILQAAKWKVVLMSAFLGPELLMQTLGLNPDDVEIIRAPKVFDRLKSRIFWCPTVRMSYKMPEKHKRFVIRAADEISNYFLERGRKGIIHVPSVALRDDFIRFSQNNKRMVAYDGTETPEAKRRFPGKEEAIANYIARPDPAILLGQSVSTGLDIPYVPTWQIITKVAFPPLGEPAVEKRKKVDKNFYTYLTICQIVQAVGRVKRAADHNGPTIILDGQFGWFYAANRKHFPAWFRDNYVHDGWQAFGDVRKNLKTIAPQYGLVLK